MTLYDFNGFLFLDIAAVVGQHVLWLLNIQENMSRVFSASYSVSNMRFDNPMRIDPVQ